MISQKHLKAILDYDPDSGDFTWKVGTRRAGKLAGCVGPNGYRVIGIGDKEIHYAHRLAWIFMTGSECATGIDHRDGSRSNNSWDNLRAATVAQNSHNSKLPARNKSGAKGVFWVKERKKWLVRMTVNRVRVVDEMLEDFDLAVVIAHEFREKYHGDFVRHV